MAKRNTELRDAVKELKKAAGGRAQRNTNRTDRKTQIEFTTIRSNFDAAGFIDTLFEEVFNDLFVKDKDTFDKLVQRAKRVFQSSSFSAQELKTMKQHVQWRIFRYGLGNTSSIESRATYGGDEYQMVKVNDFNKKKYKYPAKAKSTYPYRYKTGKLHDSVTVKQVSGGMRMFIEFSRDKKIVDSLMLKYGDFFKPTYSDVRLYQWIILKKLGLLGGQKRAAPKGVNDSYDRAIPSYGIGYRPGVKRGIRDFIRQD